MGVVLSDFLAVALKALLAHSAVWNSDVADIIGQRAQEHGYRHWAHLRQETSRFLGLGVVNTARVLGCTQQRALFLGLLSVISSQTKPASINCPFLWI